MRNSNLNSKDILFNRNIHDPNSPDIVEKDGTKIWLDENKKKHRNGGKPAVISPEGGLEWWIHGKCRQKNPNLFGKKEADGSLFWYKNNKLIAFKDSKGNFSRFKNSVLHAEGKPAYIDEFNNQFFYKNGALHRAEGPAIIIDESKKKNPYLREGVFSKIYYWRGVGFSDEKSWIEYKNRD